MKKIFTTMTVLSLMYQLPVIATDLDHPVSGSTVPDEISKIESSANSPYIINGESEDFVSNAKGKTPDFNFSPQPEINPTIDPRKEFSETGYTLPGTFEKLESYTELDKAAMARGYRKLSDGGLNLTFIKNDYDYVSTNNIIDRTVSTGADSMKGGSLFIRNDDYYFRSTLLNLHWSVGAGLGYNSGKAFFVDGSRSDTTFNLWEIPIDAGAGLELPIFSVITLAATGGPSVMGLIQNRTDFQRGDEGKRKMQYSYGYFASAQIKINMSTFSDQTAYELFTESKITNLFLNLEARHQNYSNFQDPIEISGTSFGVGFTFEYL